MIQFSNPNQCFLDKWIYKNTGASEFFFQDSTSRCIVEEIPYELWFMRRTAFLINILLHLVKNRHPNLSVDIHQRTKLRNQSLKILALKNSLFWFWFISMSSLHDNHLGWKWNEIDAFESMLNGAFLWVQEWTREQAYEQGVGHEQSKQCKWSIWVSGANELASQRAND